MTVADPPNHVVAYLSLRDNVPGPGTCLGVVAVATYPRPHHRIVDKVGSGASVPGVGPPPAPPL